MLRPAEIQSYVMMKYFNADRRAADHRKASGAAPPKKSGLICMISVGAERSPDAKLIKEWCRSTTWGQRKRRVRWPTTKWANAALMFWRHKCGDGDCFSPLLTRLKPNEWIWALLHSYNPGSEVYISIFFFSSCTIILMNQQYAIKSGVCNFSNHRLMLFCQ